MSKTTQTKKARAFGTVGASGKNFKIAGYKPAQGRDLVTCPGCGAQKYLSVGQIWKCKHGK